MYLSYYPIAENLFAWHFSGHICVRRGALRVLLFSSRGGMTNEPEQIYLHLSYPYLN